MSVAVDIDRALAVLRRSLAPGLQAATRAVALEVIDRLNRYPPPRAGQRYVRGGPGSEFLGRSWGVAVGERHGAVVTNRASYASAVYGQSPAWRAAWMHRGRWPDVAAVRAAIIQDEIGARAFASWMEAQTW